MSATPGSAPGLPDLATDPQSHWTSSTPETEDYKPKNFMWNLDIIESPIKMQVPVELFTIWLDTSLTNIVIFTLFLAPLWTRAHPEAIP